ncbi:MAG: D-alanine--D-alanine ligase, partial [Pedobacter sp.]
MKKIKIALVTGGFTEESAISVKSAENSANHLTLEGFDVYPIVITPDAWYFENGNGRTAVDKNDFTIQLKSQKTSFDMAFITIHGTPGEDGKLQGYFDLIGMRYNTCNAATSALTMNKAYTKAVVHGIDQLYTATSVHLPDRRYVKTAIMRQELK